MAISRTDCIRALQEAGAPAVEAAGIIDRMMREKRDLQAAGKNSPQELSRAWSKLQADNKRLAAMKRRQAALNIVRRNEARTFLASVRAQGFTSLDGLQAMLVGSSKRFDGARASISFQRKGIFASWTVPMIRELEAVGDGTALTLLREDKAFHDDVFREMRSPHSTGNDDARAVADIFARYGEQAIDRQNANGSDIRKRKGWTPQIHDEHKMLQAGKEAWVDFILARLDRSRTFGADAFPDEEARKILRETYSELVTGEDRTRRLHPEDSAATAPDSRERGSRVTIMSKARVLHFRDADAAIEYHDTFGRGNLFDAMIHQLDAAARRVSLAERLPSLRANGMFSSVIGDDVHYGGSLQDQKMTYAGTWGLGLQVADVSFMEDLKHTFRVLYWGGTNSPSMVKYATTRTDWNYTNDYEGIYLTTNDGLLEFNINSVYQVYDNFSIGLWLGYIANLMDSGTWQDGHAYLGDSYSKQDIWNVDLTFAYTF